MRTNQEQTVCGTAGARIWPARIVRITSVLAGIILSALILNPNPAVGVTLSDSSSVTLAWNASTSGGTTGYRVYYGTTSGNYTNSAATGDVTADTISGLVIGVTYFFAVTTYDALGLESPYSNEISYAVPGLLPDLDIRMLSSSLVVLTVTGQIGHIYTILAGQDLMTWTVIGSATIGGQGSSEFIDTNAASFTQRYYRAQ